MKRTASAWHGIEEAPRDGTFVLAWSPAAHAHHVIAFDKRAPAGWMSQAGDYVIFEDTEPLSHWMPLPEPPDPDAISE